MSNPTHWLMFNERREVVGCHCTVMPDGVDVCRWCRGDA